MSSGEQDAGRAFCYTTLFRICTTIPTVDVGIKQAHTWTLKKSRAHSLRHAVHANGEGFGFLERSTVKSFECGIP